MEIVKSVSVVICLLISIVISICLVTILIKGFPHKTIKAKLIIRCILCAIITIGCLIVYGNYSFPFERPVTIELYKTLTGTGNQVLDRPGQAFWHGAYEAYGLYAGSENFNTEDPNDNYDWPQMDFEHNNYIITYGQTANELYYNVWDKIDSPIITGAYYGHIHLTQEFIADEVYLYRIPKIRIDNDPNRQYVQMPFDDHSRRTYLLKIVPLVIFTSINYLIARGSFKERKPTRNKG